MSIWVSVVEMTRSRQTSSKRRRKKYCTFKKLEAAAVKNIG